MVVGVVDVDAAVAITTAVDPTVLELTTDFFTMILSSAGTSAAFLFEALSPRVVAAIFEVDGVGVL